MAAGLTSNKRDLASLRDIATYIIRLINGSLCGVAIVGIAGGKTREFHVTIDRASGGANVSEQRVADAIRTSNIVISPGLIDETTNGTGAC